MSTFFFHHDDCFRASSVELRMSPVDDRCVRSRLIRNLNWSNNGVKPCERRRSRPHCGKARLGYVCSVSMNSDQSDETNPEGSAPSCRSLLERRADRSADINKHHWLLGRLRYKELSSVESACLINAANIARHASNRRLRFSYTPPCTQPPLVQTVSTRGSEGIAGRGSGKVVYGRVQV